jgi:hypothetical protein
MTTEYGKAKVPRIALQKAIGADVEAALKKAEAHFALDPNDVDAQRRFFRAVVTLASQRLFTMGVPAPLIAQQAFKAVVSEHQYRHKQAAHFGQPFGPTTPAKA